MRGCRGWKHLGEDGVSPQSLENEEGDVEQMLKRLGIQQSLRKGQARGACLCTHACNIFVASPRAALREPDLLDTCHPGRKLPSCRRLCQAVIQERGGCFAESARFSEQPMPLLEEKELCGWADAARAVLSRPLESSGQAAGCSPQSNYGC